MKTVHLLSHGQPLCGFSTLPPAEWPQGMQWIYVGDYEQAHRWKENDNSDGFEFCSACVEARG